MDIFQIIAIACIGTILALTIKSYQPHLAIVVSIATGIVILAVSAGGIAQVVQEFQSVIEKSGIDIKYFTVVIKVIGIAYVTQFAAEICRDSGESSIASKVDLAGKVVVLILTIPIITNFLELIISILK